MSDKEQRKAPVLRFKGFTDDWEQRKLGDKITRIKSYSISHGYETMHDTNTKYIHYGDIHTGKVKIINDINILPNIKDNNYIGLNKGDIVVADASEDYKGIADACLVNTDTDSNKIVAGLHTIALRPQKDTYPQYLYTYLSTDIFKHFGYKTGTGLKVFGISYKELAKFLVSSPSIKEQKEISKLISLIEKNIDLHQRKLNLLNQLKKGMLQKLFAGKNQKQPNLRFKGFADTWKKETLKEVSQWSKGQGLPRKDLNAYEKGKEVIHYADLYKLGPVIKGVIHWSTSKEGRKIPTNSIIFPMSDVTPTGLARTSAVVKDGILAGGDVLIDNLSSKIQSKFLSYEINANSHQILSLVTGTTVKHINSKSLNRLSITYPNMQEQEMISNTLENIFTQIEFYRYRISKLQQLKKSLLQNMFI